jgi:hypothetical protein
VIGEVTAEFRGVGAFVALALAAIAYVVGAWLRNRADWKRAELERRRLELEARDPSERP